MIHPTELLRTNSGGETHFTAPLTDYGSEIDCGFSALPCLTERLNLEKYAKPEYFVAVLCLVYFINGFILQYFHGTVLLWTEHFHMLENFFEILTYIGDVVTGLIALILAYWGNRIHRPVWIGTLVMYLGVSCLTLMVPEIYQPFSTGEVNITNINGELLCHRPSNIDVTSQINPNNEIIAYVIFILYETVYSMCIISSISHGITYIDDHLFNTSPKHFAFLFAFQTFGKQAGLYSAWIPFLFTHQKIFLSPVWITSSVLVFLIGITVVMFPKNLPILLLKKSVTSLLNSARRTNATADGEPKPDGLFESLWRLLKNKILLLNIVSIVLMEAALVNFATLENYFNQSKYHVPNLKDASGYSDSSIIQITTNLLKNPMVAISYIICGLIIVQTRPRAVKLVTWNIIAFVIILLGFVSIRFISCTNDIKIENPGRLSIPYCSNNCSCSVNGPFQPVCLNQETYYSPCLAGCTEYSNKFYRNCQCGTGDRAALSGSCDQDSCTILWILAQVNNVTASGLFATTFITALLITLRSVLGKDKALATGLHLSILGHVTYVIRAIYHFTIDNFCEIYGKDKCQFYSINFTTFLLSTTLALMGLSILLAVILLFLVRDITLYEETDSYTNAEVESLFDDGSSYVRYNVTPGQSMQDLIMKREKNKQLDENGSSPPQQNSLLDSEDSVESEDNIKEMREDTREVSKPNRERVIETEF